MDPRLQALAGAQDGTFAAHQARRLGVADTELRRATVSGGLVRVRRGAYVTGSVWRAASPDERYRLRVIAVARSRPGDVLSHHAALAAHGLPLWGSEPSRIDLLTDTRRGSVRNGLHLHPTVTLGLEREALSTVGGVRVVPVARAIVRSALSMGHECAVVAGDAALRRGLVTVDDLYAEVTLLTPHEGRTRALEAVARMDGRAESVGESRTRMVLQDLGLAYECQVELYDAAGNFIARVDFLVEGVVVEFDGRLKYRASDADPDDPEAGASVVWLEKRREDSVRRLGHPVERIVWDELDRPGLIGVRIRAARALVRNTPGRSQLTRAATR